MNTKTQTPIQKIINACNKLQESQNDQATRLMLEMIQEECNRQLKVEKDLIIQAFIDGNNIATSKVKLTASKYVKQVFTDKTKDENTNAKFNLLHGSDAGRNKKRSKKKAAQ